ncbi:hypothetical protein BH24ACT10_BH24ACT10_01690 [soil metagenome]
MIDFFDASNLLLLALGLLTLAIKVWALVDAVTRPGPAYAAAGKLTKPIWLSILVAAVLLGGTNVMGLLGLLGTVAAIVYLADVRPAVRELRPGGPWG